MKSVCYFGNFNERFSRNKVYIDGLKQNGATVTLCQTTKRFPFNIVELYRKFVTIKNEVDTIVVGYPGHEYVWIAKLICHKKNIIFDALCSLQDPAHSRSIKPQPWWYMVRAILLDNIAFRLANVILVESEEQKKYITQQYSLNPKKTAVLYTGASDKVFQPITKNKDNQFPLVIFRGKFLPEAGVKYIIDAAKILESTSIQLIIIGNGFLLPEINKYYEQKKPKNCQLITEEMSENDLVSKMGEADIFLGQFEKHRRLYRTIPHKAYEAMAMKTPYITADYPAIREVMKDQESCLLVTPANPHAIANAIMQLINNKQLRMSLSKNGNLRYLSKYNPYQLGKHLLSIIANSI